MINPGGMRYRATFQSPPQTPDSMGGRSGPWETVATVWAQVEPLRGQALLEAQQIIHEVDTKITVRYNKNIFENQRIQFTDVTTGKVSSYKILSIAVPFLIKKEMVIMATRLASGEPI